MHYFVAIVFPWMIFDQWSFVDLFANVPTKFFLWIQTNNWLSTYLHEEDWHKTGRKLSDEQAGARWPGQWPQFDWDKRETMARFSKQQQPPEFCEQIYKRSCFRKVVKKAGLWYAALNKQLVGHRVVSNTAEEWSRRSWGQAVASLIGCTQTGVNHQGWVWQKQVSKNEQNCGV